MESFGAKLSKTKSRANKSQADIAKVKGFLCSPSQMQGKYFRGLKEL
jgi:hypothetical protein